MTVLITLTVAGADSGPFNLFSNLDGYTSAFATGISKSALLAGYSSSVVPDYTTIVRVVSIGNCTNYIDIVLGEVTTTTTTSNTTSTPPGPTTIVLSQLTNGCPVPGFVPYDPDDYDYTVTVDSLPINVGSLLTGALPPANDAGAAFYYTSAYFGLKFDSSGIVTEIIDCTPT
jgi:hypothetical protein